MVNKEKLIDVSTLISGISVNLINGSIYLWGTIAVYVTSYFRLKENPDLSTATTGVLFAVSTAVQAFFMPFSVQVCRKMGFKRSFILCGVVFTACIFICSYMENFWSFFFFYGVIFNIFTGIVYLAPVYVVCKLFPASKGLVTGIIMSSFGVASSISGIFFVKMINPNDVHPVKPPGGNEKLFPAEIAMQLPSTFRYLAIYFGFLTVICALTYLRKGVERDDTILYQQAPKSDHEHDHDELQEIHDNNTDYEGHSEHHEDNNAMTSHKESSNLGSDRNPKPTIPIKTKPKILDLCKTRAFWSMAFMIAFSAPYPLYISSNFKVYGIKRISDDNFLTILGSVALVFNGVARIGFGRIYDYLSFKKIYTVILALEITTCITISFIAETPALYFIWICIGFVCLGGHFSVFSVLAIKYFGLESGSKVYGFIFFAFPAANFMQFGYNLAAIDFDNFDNIFWIFLAGMAISCVILFRFKETKS